MKKILLLVVLLSTSFLIKAQTTLKASKPISKTDWAEFQNNTFSLSYGTVAVINDDGIVERLVADKPSNPQDKVTWRPPPIPPKDNPDNPSGVKANPLKPKKMGSVKPKPIDPGCPTCSVFIFSEAAPADVVQKAQAILKQYN